MVLKKACCALALVALKRTGYDVCQMECQASNVTANVQSGHFVRGYMLPVFFVTDQLHRPPSCAEIQPMKFSVTCPYRRLVLDTRAKMKKMKICAFYKVVRLHFQVW